MKHDYVNLWYFKLKLLDLTEFIVWNIKGLWHWIVKIKGLENFVLKTQLLYNGGGGDNGEKEILIENKIIIDEVTCLDIDNLFK